MAAVIRSVPIFHLTVACWPCTESVERNTLTHRLWRTWGTYRRSRRSVNVRTNSMRSPGDRLGQCRQSTPRAMCSTSKTSLETLRSSARMYPGIALEDPDIDSPEINSALTRFNALRMTSPGDAGAAIKAEPTVFHA